MNHDTSGCIAMPNRQETIAYVAASAEELFALLDDQTRLTSHMSRRTWRMGWGRMETVLDGGRGRSVGSVIRISGRVLGIRLALEEVVTERQPPHHKVWQTIGEPRLLVIGPYRMGFEVSPLGAESSLRVFVDYALPSGGPPRALGRLFAASYARWCTRSMVHYAVGHFQSNPAHRATD